MYNVSKNKPFVCPELISCHWSGVPKGTSGIKWVNVENWQPQKLNEDLVLKIVWIQRKLNYFKKHGFYIIKIIKQTENENYHFIRKKV